MSAAFAPLTGWKLVEKYRRPDGTYGTQTSDVVGYFAETGQYLTSGDVLVEAGEGWLEAGIVSMIPAAPGQLGWDRDGQDGWTMDKATPVVAWALLADGLTRALCLEPTGICVGVYEYESPLKPATATATPEQIAQWAAELQATDAAA